MGQTVISAPIVQTGQAYPYDPVKNPLGLKSWTQYWKTSTTNGNNINSYPTSRIIYANGIYAFVINSGFVFYSTDAKNWNTQYVGSANMYCLAYGNNTWVVAGYAGVLYTGTPGGTWTARTSQFGASAYIYDVRWIPTVSLFIACGSPTSSGACAIASSPDGITWTNRFNDVNSGAIYAAIDYDPSTTTITLACGNATNNVYYSTNGTSWTGINPCNEANYTTQFLRGALNRFVAGRSSILSSTTANITSVPWYSQSPAIYFQTPNNNSTWVGGVASSSNHIYEMQYDSVNNYYYQYAPQSYYSSALQNGVMELITYDASTVINTNFNNATQYNAAFPIIKTETVPLTSLYNGGSRVPTNFGYGYANGVHILAGNNMGTDLSFQIYTTA